MSFKKKLNKLIDDILITILMILALTLFITFCSSCVTAESAQKPTEKPKPGRDDWAEVDKAFCDEVDACFVPYRKCKAEGKPERECFPPHEKCVIEAYRKWKKARGK